MQVGGGGVVGLSGTALSQVRHRNCTGLHRQLAPQSLRVCHLVYHAYCSRLALQTRR
jgi:hypothetical protein